MEVWLLEMQDQARDGKRNRAVLGRACIHMLVLLNPNLGQKSEISKLKPNFQVIRKVYLSR